MDEAGVAGLVLVAGRMVVSPAVCTMATLARGVVLEATMVSALPTGGVRRKREGGLGGGKGERKDKSEEKGK